MPNVLIVTNDFPPRRGGIQSFVHALAAGMPGRHGHRLRPGLVRFRRVRRPSAVPGDPASGLADAAGAIGRAPRRGDPARERLRHGAVRRCSSARIAGSGIAPGWRGPDRRDHARPRGSVGGAARRPLAAPQDRRSGGRHHLSRRVLQGPAGQGAVAGRRGADGAARTRGGHHGIPAGRRGSGDQSAARAGRPADCPVRVPDGAAEGPGHPDPGLAAGPRRSEPQDRRHASRR